MFGTITVQTIVCRGEAVKRGWISTADTDESTGNVMHVIEEGQSHDEHHGQPGDDGRLSYREVYGTSEDKVAEFTVRSPMSMQGIEAQSALSGLRQALQITASTAGAEEVDPDEVLMAQYHQEVSNHQLMAATSSEDMPSFEEWKVERKQFKQGTRGSFVKAFQVWEEREQLAADATISSGSVRHAMQMYGGSRKNALDTKSRRKL
jgi:hypothetical protein